jgi:hypothetical protein
MPSIHDKLSHIKVGDIIHGGYRDTGSAICLVTSLTEDAIFARTVTTQWDLVFDRRTGTAVLGASVCRLDSIAPLPIDIYDALLDIDRKYRLLNAPEGSRLLDHEKRALIFVADSYPANPL